MNKKAQSKTNKAPNGLRSKANKASRSLKKTPARKMETRDSITINPKFAMLGWQKKEIELDGYKLVLCVFESQREVNRCKVDEYEVGGIPIIEIERTTRKPQSVKTLTSENWDRFSKAAAVSPRFEGATSRVRRIVLRNALTGDELDIRKHGKKIIKMPVKYINGVPIGRIDFNKAAQIVGELYFGSCKLFNTGEYSMSCEGIDA